MTEINDELNAKALEFFGKPLTLTLDYLIHQANRISESGVSILESGMSIAESTALAFVAELDVSEFTPAVWWKLFDYLEILKAFGVPLTTPIKDLTLKQQAAFATTAVDHVDNIINLKRLWVEANK